MTVRCTLYSTVIKVVFADSIEDNFEENGYRTDVMIGKTFNADSADKLTYTKTESGYFNFPDGQNAISFRFNGKLKTGETKEVVFTQDDFEIKPEELHGYRHTLTFKYTVVNPDDGYITLKVKTEKEKTIDTSVGINPDRIVSEGTQDIGTAKLASSLWSGSVKLSAYTTAEEGSDVKIEYRIADVTTRAEEGWIPLETQKDEAEGENYYSANLTLAPSTVYEYRLTVNGEPAGDVQSVETPVAPQIPNGGFEEWYEESGLLNNKFMSPSKDKASKWWHTGNGGSTMLSGSDWITQPNSDVRTDANGTTSAYMRVKKVAGKLASGNIFIGNFLGTIGTEGGSVAFGREFPYNYKPKKLRFWVKANAGKDDTNNLYVILGKMNGPHVVNTTTKGPSFIDFTQNSETITYCDGKTADNATKPSSKQDPNNAEGKIIAWGSWDNSGSIAEWTMVELDLTYNTGEGYDGVMPNYLIINATTCKRGDYFEGSTDSWMYLDDVEFVY